MADKPNLSDPDVDAAAADHQAAIEKAVTPAKPAKAQGRDAAIQEAQEAELKRQKAVADAVAKANAEELPKLGGPMKNPGLGI
jgi:hypothetical protein